MRKIWTIAWKEVITTFGDRNSILIMIATPLALSTIIGLAFSQVGGSDVPVQDIPVAVVNLDRGNLLGVNFGQVYVTALVPDASGKSRTQAAGSDCSLGATDAPAPTEEGGAAPINLFDLTDAEALDAPLAQTLVADGDADPSGFEPGTEAYITSIARSAVENGRYTAAIIIPEDFSASLSYIPGRHPQLEETKVDVYANSGRPIASQIIRSIVAGITNQILTGNITVAATWTELDGSGASATIGSALSNLELASAFACAFSPDANTLGLDARAIAGAGHGNAAVDALVMFGSAQAIFFGLFTAGFGVLSMHDERRNWTLQRLVISPTPRSYILAGKLAGVAVTVLFQITLLLIALTLVGSIIKGELLLIWGANVPLILIVLLSATLAVSGYGMFMAGIVKSPEQGQIVGSMLTIGLAALGGTFGFTLPEEIASVSLIYWGRTAFEHLANGQTDVGLHIAVLGVQGLVLYGLGVLFFNRNFEL